MRPGKPKERGRRAGSDEGPETGVKPKQTVQDKRTGGGQDARGKNCLHSWSQALAGKASPSAGPWELHLGLPRPGLEDPRRLLAHPAWHPSFCS